MPDHLPKFATGSILRHVLVMTGAGAAGLMAIFAVDFLNMFYISLLGEQELAAAIGYAGTLLFVGTSVSIGIMISGTALVSKAIGARDREESRQLAGSAMLYMGGILTLMTLASLPFLGRFLSALGAEGRTLQVAWRFLLMVWPSMPLLALGMMCAGLLRAIGDARRSMYVTMSGGLLLAALDPLLIFALDMGVDGAALASVISRICMMAVGLHACIRCHHMVAWPSMAGFRRHVKALSAIAIPAVMTNVATPVGNIFVTAAIAPYGDAAVAGWAVLGRITPLAYGVTFSLSAAVGPIIGQNFGAGLFPRIRETMTQSLRLVIIYCLMVWAILAVTGPMIARAFSLTGDGAGMVIFFGHWVAGLFIFNGALFVANAAFNNLGAPIMSMLFNWGRATLGTVPFIYYGGRMMGADGVILGQGLGGVVFGIAAVIFCYRFMSRQEKHHDRLSSPA